MVAVLDLTCDVDFLCMPQYSSFVCNGLPELAVKRHVQELI